MLQLVLPLLEFLDVLSVGLDPAHDRLHRMRWIVDDRLGVACPTHADECGQQDCPQARGEVAGLRWFVHVPSPSVDVETNSWVNAKGVSVLPPAPRGCGPNRRKLASSQAPHCANPPAAVGTRRATAPAPIARQECPAPRLGAP